MHLDGCIRDLADTLQALMWRLNVHGPLFTLFEYLSIAVANSIISPKQTLEWREKSAKPTHVGQESCEMVVFRVWLKEMIPFSAPIIAVRRAKLGS